MECIRRLRRIGALWVAQALIGVIVLGAQSAAAEPFEVGARTTVDVRLSSVGTQLRVEGTLRDDVGQPVAFRSVRISGEAGDNGFETQVLSDTRGGFRYERVVVPGSWEVEAAFVGDYFVEPAEGRSVHTVARERADVSIAAPGIVGVDLETLPVRIRVRVGDRPAPEVVVSLTASCGVVEALPETDSTGNVAALVRVRERTGGPCVLHASTRGTDAFEPAASAATVRRIESPTLSVDARFHRPSPFEAGTWTLDVSARDRHGPIGGVRAVAMVDGVTVAEERTDGRGLAALSLAPVGEASTTARVSLVADAGGLALTSDPIVLEPPPNASTVFGWWSALAVLLVASLAVWAAVREIRRARPVRENSARPAVEAIPPPVDDGRWWIVVCDEDERSRIANAVLDGDGVSQEGEGAFVCEGRHCTVRVSAPGYVPVTHRIERPMDGQSTVIALRSFAAEVREILRSEVSRVAPDDATWWGRDTIARVRRRVASQLRTLRKSPQRERLQSRELERLLAAFQGGRADAVDRFEALTYLADVTYFGGRTADARTLALAHALVSSTPRADSVAAEDA